MRMFHQRDVGPQAPDGVDRLCAVAGLAHDLHVGLLLEHEPEAAAHHRLVVGDDHAQAHARASSSGRVARTA
jgi:hypothetical protein